MDIPNTKEFIKCLELAIADIEKLQREKSIK
jgi:hypothetical protein